MTPRRRRRTHWLLGFFASGIVVVLVVLLLWDWNWFRPLAEREASAATGRSVTIGNLDVHLGFEETAVLLDDVSLGNPDGFPAGSKTATLGRLTVKIRPLELFHHRAVLSLIDLDRLNADLKRGAHGEPNWALKTTSPPPDKDAKPWRVDLGSLQIEDGRVHFADAKLKADFQLAIHTDTPREGGEPSIVATIDGKYSGQPITGRFIGGSILSLRDVTKPYPVDLKLVNGKTRVALAGTIVDPQHMAGANLTLSLDGEDLADLYPLTGIPLAQTPPYSLKGQLDYAEHKIRFRDFNGTVGQSDLEGTISVDPGHERPQVTADLRSRRVVLADLGGFIGAAPGKKDAPTEGAKQKAEHARQDASPKLLPDKKINLPKLRSADVFVHYKGDRIEGTKAPLDNFVANLTIVNGALELHPLSFGVGTGSIVLNVKLNGQEDLVHVVADVDFRHLDLHRVMESTQVFHGAGTIGGAARIDTVGNSIAQMAAKGDGELKLFMSGGDLSSLLVDLAGLDFGSSVFSALGLPSNTDVRCLVTDFQLQSGLLRTRTMLFDTTEANVLGTGDVDLRAETIKYRLSTEPKHFSIGSLRSPIDIDGPLKKPSIRPEVLPLGARGAAAVILGVVLTPVAALLPTIQLGLGEDHNCAALLESVHSDTDRIKAQQAADKTTPAAPASAAKHRAVRR